MGHIYTIELRTNSVALHIDEGSSVDSETRWDDYGYTHGGRIYREAVSVAKEIRDAMINKRAKESDI